MQSGQGQVRFSVFKAFKMQDGRVRFLTGFFGQVSLLCFVRS